MRSRGLLVLLAALALLVCIWLLLSGTSTPVTADLSVVFIGPTNDPGKSVYPQLSVVSDGRGMHALFALTNVNQSEHLQFGISSVETQDGSGWRSQGAPVFSGALGYEWAPGYGAIYAVPWPTGSAKDTPWRLRLWVMREPKLAALNQWIKRDIFRPHGQHAVTSSIVTPLRLLAVDSEPHERNAQPIASPEPPPAASVLESSETMNTEPESEAPVDGGGR